MTTPLAIILLLIILAILVVILVFRARGNVTVQLDKKYLGKAGTVLDLYLLDPIKACLQADSLLDKILQDMGYQGSMGDKLKSGRKLFSKDEYDNIWNAHKIRNKIAHEGHDRLIEKMAFGTRKIYRQVFIKLGIKL